MKYEKAIKDKPAYADVDIEAEEAKYRLFHQTVVEMNQDKMDQPATNKEAKIDSLKFYRDTFINKLKDIK